MRCAAGEASAPVSAAGLPDLRNVCAMQDATLNVARCARMCRVLREAGLIEQAGDA